MAQVEKNKVVEIHYTLRLSDGTIEDTTEGEAPLPYLHGAGNIIPGLESALEGRNVGDRFEVTLQPADAYGDYDEELTEEIPLDAFPDNTEITEGEEIWVEAEDGTAAQGVVERIDETTAYVNYNHPLAGEALTFEVEVVDVRDATPEELEHGHAHDAYSDEDEDDWDDDDFEDDDDEDWDEDDFEDEEDEDEDMENGRR